MGLKDFFNKIKEENAGFMETTKRINGTGFCGNVNRGIKGGDFWEGSYVNVEGSKGVIYASATSQEDYYFTAEQIASFDVVGTADVSVGDKVHPGMRCKIVFADGKTAQADIVTAKMDFFKNALGIK